jgi:hypothetical protein
MVRPLYSPSHLTLVRAVRAVVAVAAVVPCALLLSLCGGCLIRPWNPAATQPATVQNLATTQPEYWLSQPATAGVLCDDFDKLWTQSENTARECLFTLDRQDYRLGLLTTQPLVSRQWFEPWRPDCRTLRDDELSSSATIRRTLQFQFTRVSESQWVVTPIVLVERNSVFERRVTATISYRDAYLIDPKSNNQPSGSREEDVGIILPARYWYLTGRDPQFEQYLAEKIKRKIHNAKLISGPAATQPAS